MRRKDLVSIVAKENEISKDKVGEILDSAFNAIGNALIEGDKVYIRDFGTFEVRERAGKRGVHPITGESIQIEPSKHIGFKVSSRIKELLTVD